MKTEQKKELLEEMMTKHRTIKHQMLVILEKAEKSSVSKELLREELFKLYVEIK